MASNKAKLIRSKIPYTVRKSKRAKRMRMAVYCDGRVVVTLPRGFCESAAERFVREKAGWLSEKISHFKQFKNNVFSKRDKAHYLKHKEEALVLVNERLRYFNKFYQFSYNNITVRNQKTRWGSCSKRGNLNFNYKILFLPPKVADYLVVHELCHLGEFNHSHRFWRLVAQKAPDYLGTRKEFRDKGFRLF